jgi:hypothetical protein
MEDDSVAALNGIIGTPAKLLFTMGKKTEKYELNSRCSIKLAKGQATLKWSNDWTGYAWGDSYLERTVIHLPNVAVKPDYPGGWNISQLRSVTRGQGRDLVRRERDQEQARRRLEAQHRLGGVRQEHPRQRRRTARTSARPW